MSGRIHNVRLVWAGYRLLEARHWLGIDAIVLFGNWCRMSTLTLHCLQCLLVQ